MNIVKKSILSTACLAFLFVAPVWADQEFGPQKAQVLISPPQPAGNTQIKVQPGQHGQGFQGRPQRNPYGGYSGRFRGNDQGNGNREFGNRDRGFRDTGFRDRDRGDRRYHHRDRDFNDALPAAAFGLINAIVHDNDRKGRRHRDRFMDQDDTYRCKIYDNYRGRYVWSTCRR